MLVSSFGGDGASEGPGPTGDGAAGLMSRPIPDLAGVRRDSGRLSEGFQTRRRGPTQRPIPFERRRRDRARRRRFAGGVYPSALAFSASALGQAVRGVIDVLDDTVRLEIELPGLLGALAKGLEGRLRKAGQLLLARK